jgi:alpha-D-xyloside xylohydrolase
VGEFAVYPWGIEWSEGYERMRVQAWCEDSIRVRVGLDRLLDDLPGALLPIGDSQAMVNIDEAGATVVNGRIECEVSAAGAVRFRRAADGEELLAERAMHSYWPGARRFEPLANGFYRLEQRFAAYDAERLFGLGQHQDQCLDQKGRVVELAQRNGEVSIPFLVSSRGYAMLWNSPAIGRVELAGNATRWVADSARQIDYWVTTGDTPMALLGNYADATGHAPAFPSWATGFWQSRLRYRTQEELLTVAREHKARQLPLSVIVCDFYHWTQLGDWRFDATEWPDPTAMVQELADMGVKLMVSVWPSVSPLSENYAAMLDAGLLIATDHGTPALNRWIDQGHDQPIGIAFYDATNADARAFVWAQVREHYYAHGIKLWWLDACEPEIRPGSYADLRFAAGPGLEVANLYPREHVRGFYDAMSAEGETEILMLCRSAWAGSQRYGALVWSGDIPATFESLKIQIRAGLNMAMSGIPWWNTDIGGFEGGDHESPVYRELLVRWFQYAAFTPVFRLHGDRAPQTPMGHDKTGGPNEVWSYGAEAYALIRDVLELRERLRPYVQRQMDTASATGAPPMRPLFVDFPHDAESWTIEDAFLLGPDLLVAPVTDYGARTRSVYLPGGARWANSWTEEKHDGGQWLEVESPIDYIPVFARDEAEVPVAGERKPEASDARSGRVLPADR